MADGVDHEKFSIELINKTAKTFINEGFILKTIQL